MTVGCKEIDAGMVAKMFLAGARNLEAKKEWINELNVFPVPDGDTGTNMTMTVLSAAREVAALQNPDMKEVAKAIASGSLRGARGNSGVILSQLFRGFAKGIQGHKRVDAPILSDAFAKAVETAYKAVMKPKEGTILTVARSGADRAMELCQDGVLDLEDFFREIIEQMDYTLSQTPQMLPILKQAGVVDSGGQGLVEVLRGAYEVFLGKEVSLETFIPTKAAPAASFSVQEEEIRYGYCTEFIIMPEKPVAKAEEEELKAYLESVGDSIVMVADEEVIKVHVHTDDPGLVLQKALTYGALSNMKIDNMRLEHREKLFKMSEKSADLQEPSQEPLKEVEQKEVGFIAVSMGEGLNQIFRELGVDYVISGGQTMNPSTEDILNAIAQVHADTVFILPNNKNIILAANQARDLTGDKKVVVIPTKTVPQGITAVITYVPEQSAEENESAMLEEIGRVRTGQVTYAVRDTSVDGKEIRQGDYMGIGDEGIVAVNASLEQAVLATIHAIVNGTTELLSIYYGNEVSRESAEKLKEKVENRHPDMDVELQDGGQPIYYYLISAE